MEEKGGLWEGGKESAPIVPYVLGRTQSHCRPDCTGAGKQKEVVRVWAGVGLLSSSQAQPLSWVLTLS